MINANKINTLKFFIKHYFYYSEDYIFFLKTLHKIYNENLSEVKFSINDIILNFKKSRIKFDVDEIDNLFYFLEVFLMPEICIVENDKVVKSISIFSSFSFEDDCSTVVFKVDKKVFSYMYLKNIIDDTFLFNIEKLKKNNSIDIYIYLKQSDGNLNINKNILEKIGYSFNVKRPNLEHYAKNFIDLYINKGGCQNTTNARNILINNH